MKKSLCFIVFLSVIILWNFPVYAQERVIKLKDGNVLHGKILSKENDTYKIESKTLGVLAVKDADIVSIEEDKAQQNSMDAYQQRIVNDPRMMENITALSKDPQVIEILSDPNLQKAIATQDVEYLRNNEKFLKFSNLPSVRQIITNAMATEKSDTQDSK